MAHLGRAADKGTRDMSVTVRMTGRFTVSYEQPTPPPTAPKYNGWRCIHTIEGGRWVPPGMPEERTPEGWTRVWMTEPIQRMSYWLMTHANPSVTPNGWTKVHRWDKCFNNNQGFERDGDPRANYIMGIDLDAELPAYDKAMRICGGTFITGSQVGDKLVCRAGVDGIDADSPMPETETILRHNWFTHAVSVNNDYKVISHFPQGNGGPVLVPFIFRNTITFPLEWFQRWQADELPDPLKIYLPMVEVPREEP